MVGDGEAGDEAAGAAFLEVGEPVDAPLRILGVVEEVVGVDADGAEADAGDVLLEEVPVVVVAEAAQVGAAGVFGTVPLGIEAGAGEGELQALV